MTGEKSATMVTQHNTVKVATCVCMLNHTDKDYTCIAHNSRREDNPANDPIASDVIWLSFMYLNVKCEKELDYSSILYDDLKV